MSFLKPESKPYQSTPFKPVKSLGQSRVKPPEKTGKKEDKNPEDILKKHLGEIAKKDRKSRQMPRRELHLNSISLVKEFKSATHEEFYNYCLAAFGLKINSQAITRHKKLPFSQLKEHWKLKYLSFFYFLKSSGGEN